MIGAGNSAASSAARAAGERTERAISCSSVSVKEIIRPPSYPAACQGKVILRRKEILLDLARPNPAMSCRSSLRALVLFMTLFLAMYDAHFHLRSRRRCFRRPAYADA